MRLEKNMDAYFKDMADMNTGHLSVGSSSFFCAYLLAGLLKRFKNKYPGVSVEIHEGNIRELRAGLLDDSIDLLLETAIPAGDEVERYLYDYEQIILAVPAEFEVNFRWHLRRPGTARSGGKMYSRCRCRHSGTVRLSF